MTFAFLSASVKQFTVQKQTKISMFSAEILMRPKYLKRMGLFEVISSNVEVLCKWDIWCWDRDETETLEWQYRDETATFKNASGPRHSRLRL